MRESWHKIGITFWEKIGALIVAYKRFAKFLQAHREQVRQDACHQDFNA